MGKCFITCSQQASAYNQVCIRTVLAIKCFVVEQFLCCILIPVNSCFPEETAILWLYAVSALQPLERLEQ